MKKFLVTMLVISYLITPVCGNCISNSNSEISEQENLNKESKTDKVLSVILFPIALPFGVLYRTLNTVGNVLDGNFYKPWLSNEERSEIEQKLNQDINSQKWKEQLNLKEKQEKERQAAEETESLNRMKRQCAFAFKHNEDVQEFTQEMLQNDYISHYKQHEQKIDEYYQLFLKDKNNMKNNRILYDILDEKYKQYHKVHLDYNSAFSNTFLAECTHTIDNNRRATFEEFLEKNPCELESINIYFAFYKNYKRIYEIKEEIYTYSKDYEQNKYKDWAKRNNKKPLCGALEPYIYYPYAPQPQVGCLYTAPPGGLPIYVFQTVPGGVILTGSTSVMAQYGFSLNSVFLQTSQHFADNQRIHSFMGEFKGYYDYTTVLGARKRIYKFYRLGQKEIDANFTIPGQPFYFYQPY